ncbi:hypothetical protein Dsin_031000 [Dipteronia sinensis]|uniref:Uncharacterized protein n=1 Tax=Dipteronia sinensis TaxID=43782 RepID=A0AAD9ZM00_9ROSI|nr:hypothetical protein Dsin_031000 [Dipteronia sinensis]
MKREGRQHGLVRTYRIIPSPLNPRPDSRFVNRFESPPTSGLFTKVPTKPTNHSKFTGKCGKSRCTTCHLHPACKSKDKTKGTQKLNSRDMVYNHKLITWRVVDARPGLNFSGFSASGILDHLGSGDYYNYMDDDEVDDYYDDHDGASYDQHHYNDDVGLMGQEERALEMGGGGGSSSEVADNRDGVDEYNDVEDENDEGVMSFCDVGMVFDQVIEGEEGWCLVGDGDIM